MKYICIILWLIPIFSFSQIEDPVSWSFNVEKLGKDKYNLKVVAQIEDGWHIYSQYKDPDSFIRETSFYFELIDDVKFIDTKIQKIDDLSVKIFFQEDKPVEKFLEIQGELARYFENKANFSQQIILKKSIDKVKGLCEFMVCNDVQCLPPKIIDMLFFVNFD